MDKERRIELLVEARRNRRDSKMSDSYALTQEELERIYAELGTNDPEDIRKRAMIALSVCCALRGSECTNLRMDDLNWRQGKTEAVKLSHTKNGKSYVLPVNTFAWLALSEWLDIRKAKLKQNNTDSPYVVCIVRRHNRDNYPDLRVGGKLNVGCWNQSLKHLRKRVGLDRPLRSHIFRHTGITHFARKSKDVFLTKIFGHHESVSSSQRYFHADPDQIRDVLETINGPSPEELRKQELEKRFLELMETAAHIRAELDTKA